MKNKRRNKVMLLVILLLALSIGFAALSTTLKINGTANIGKNSWNIYWDNVANKTGVTPVSGPTIGNDSQGGVNTQVTFEINLNEPGDFYEFTVDAVNAGTLDAMITSIAETLNGNPVTSQNKLPDYIKFDVTYADGIEIGQYHLLPKATVSGNTTTPTVETYKVRIEYDRDAVDSSNLPASDTTYTLTYSITYAQADERAIPKPVWRLPSGKTRDTLSVGDELCLQDQCFNFIKYDGNDVVMLAKWNLKVGDIYNSPYQPQMRSGTYTSSDEGYGLQSSDVRGVINSETVAKGVVPFSKVNYWGNSGSNIYDSENRAGAPEYDDSGFPTNNLYSIAYYVEQYKTKLTNDYNAPIKSARVLTIPDLTDSTIGCSSSRCQTTGTSAFITNTSSWIATATEQNFEKIKGLYASGYIENIYYQGRFDYRIYCLGVRPVLVVEKSNL